MLTKQREPGLPHRLTKDHGEGKSPGPWWPSLLIRVPVIFSQGRFPAQPRDRLDLLD